MKLAEPLGSQYAGTAAGRHKIHILSLMQNSSHSEEGKGWVGRGWGVLLLIAQLTNQIDCSSAAKRN